MDLLPAVLLLFITPFTQAQSCVTYEVSPSQPMYCNSEFASCDYVLPPQELSLTQTEDQLEAVFNLTRISVQTGEISQECFSRFSALYCRQVFSFCREVESLNGTSNVSTALFVPANTSLCSEDCVTVIETNCLDQGWAILTNAINKLRRDSNISLPSLKQTDECKTTLTTTGEDCTSISDGPPPTDRCTQAQLPTTDNPTSNNGFNKTLIVAVCLGVGIPVVVLSVLIFLISFCCCQVRKPKRRGRRDSVAHSHDGNGSVNPLQEAIEFKLDVPDNGPINDPETAKRGTLMMRQSAYHNALFLDASPRSSTLARRLASKEYQKMTPKQRLQALDFPHNNICLLKDLWETNFGMTYQGEATGLEEDSVSSTIFIKSLKERASSKIKQQFLIEMTWASGFNHPNVITLLGVCREEPLFMIYEYLEYGSLKDFLQSLNSAWFDFDEVLNETASTCPSTSAAPLGIEDLCSIVCQVAQGMDYLSKKAFVLKDLAARNCQVGNGLQVKIASFGLSYDQHSKDYCCLNSAKSTPLPLRWLAPESIRGNKFSVYSDIWSYGVLMWEVFTFGNRPFDKLTNAQVVQHILNEKFLPRPEKSPESVYKLMIDCWSKQPSKRPWFSVLSKELSDIPRNMSFDEKRAFGGTPSTPDLRRPVSSVLSIPEK